MSDLKYWFHLLGSWSDRLHRWSCTGGQRLGCRFNGRFSHFDSSQLVLNRFDEIVGNFPYHALVKNRAETPMIVRFSQFQQRGRGERETRTQTWINADPTEPKQTQEINFNSIKWHFALWNTNAGRTEPIRTNHLLPIRQLPETPDINRMETGYKTDIKKSNQSETVPVDCVRPWSARFESSSGPFLPISRCWRWGDVSSGRLPVDFRISENRNQTFVMSFYILI